ncbi:MAG TPA: hypothetical protein DCY56_04705 [Candidatus Omnitrophica bacterium]|nr:hypothetical protein [Candidatus Omnitrophota bacterium]
MAKLKILLLFPNTGNEGVMPLAIGILSSIAKLIRYEVKYFEASFYKKRVSAGEERERTGEFKFINREKVFELLPYKRLQDDFNKTLINYKPDILAVTANSLEYELFCELIEGARLIKPKPFIIVGGVHATIVPDDVIKNPYVDVLCIGEGEKAWKEFLIKFKTGQDSSTIKNLWVKNHYGIKKNPPRPLLSEKELWGTPMDLSYFDERHFMKPYDGKMYRRGQVELSRGCPYNCSYCVNSTFKDIYKGLGKFFRVRPFDNLQKGVKRIIQLGCNMLQLQDECFFNIPYHILEKFCKWYCKEIKLPLLLQTRPESVTEEKVKLVADMGVPIQISCGIESGSERILRDICNRHTTLGQIKNAFKIIKKYKLRSNAYTMIGFPTETREEVFKTIFLIREINPDVSIMSVFFPFEGVPLRKICIENGYIFSNEKARTYTDASILKKQPMSGEEIENLRRTYRLYTTLPEEYFSKIELCEKDYKQHKVLFDELVALSWRLRQ